MSIRLVAALCAVTACARAAVADETPPPVSPSPKFVATVEVKDGNVVEVLHQLFRQRGVQYLIRPGVRGTITCSFYDFDWELLLDYLTNAVGARVTRDAKGIYLVEPRRPVERLPPAQPERPQPPPMPPAGSMVPSPPSAPESPPRAESKPPLDDPASERSHNSPIVTAIIRRPGAPVVGGYLYVGQTFTSSSPLHFLGFWPGGCFSGPSGYAMQFYNYNYYSSFGPPGPWFGH